MTVSQPANILLVDDQPNNILALSAILERPDYRLLCARSGAEALNIALHEELALVLLDVIMPGMDGFEVAEYLKQAQRTRHVPIIFLTAVASDVRHIYRAYNVGAVDYLIKPLQTEIVRQKVAVFVELFRQRKELVRQAEILRANERRQHELQLAESRLASDRRYRRLVEGIDHAIAWSMDAETHQLTFISRQAERILGYGLEELTAPNFWFNCAVPPDRELMMASLRSVVDEGLDHVCDHRMRTAEGAELWFHTAAAMDRTVDGRPEIHGVSVDVTRLKQAETEARRATASRDEMLAVVSHDLRNPLASILMCATKLERTAAKLPEPERARVLEPARTVTSSAKRMNRLIDDLLDLGVINAGRLQLKPRKIEAALLVKQTFEVLEPVAAEKGLELVAQLDEAAKAAAAMCDPDRMVQALTNLVGNAIKFTPVHGKVEVSVRRSGDALLFCVADTGPGIPAEQLPHIFERFWHGSDTGSGTGLGLAIVKGIVEAHHGRVWVTSALGTGTSIFFSIPSASEVEGEGELAFAR